MMLIQLLLLMMMVMMMWDDYLDQKLAVQYPYGHSLIAEGEEEQQTVTVQR